MCYEAVPEMRAQKWGRVVAITSIAVRQPIPTLILSNTARAGLTGFLQTLAREVAVDGVTVNSLLPGLHATERRRRAARHRSLDDLAAGIPAGCIGDPGDFGSIGAFLCSEHARYRHRHRDPGRRWRLRGLLLMFRHVVLLTFIDDTDAPRTSHAVDDALLTLPARLPQLQDVRHRDAISGSTTRTPTFAVVADFDDVDGYVAYRDDPEHKRIIAELITPDPRRPAPPRSTRSVDARDGGHDLRRLCGHVHDGDVRARGSRSRFRARFAAGCVLSSVYGFLSGAWPFGVVELIWAGVAVHRYRQTGPHLTP